MIKLAKCGSAEGWSLKRGGRGRFITLEAFPSSSYIYVQVS